MTLHAWWLNGAKYRRPESPFSLFGKTLKNTTKIEFVSNSIETATFNNCSLEIQQIKIAKSDLFVKIRPPDFLCNEFLIKMYRFLQTYTFEICTLTKIMNICCKYNIFTGRSLFTRKGNQLISYPRTLVCYCGFDMVFIFIINSYKYQNVFKIYQQTS